MKYPLMRNNILREDLDKVIVHLQKDDPKLTQGEHVNAFEKEWSSWLGVKHSVFVNSGASANLITLAALKIKYPDGGEVIVPPLTWVSDVASVLQNGFKPVFADIDKKTLSMSTDEILSKITKDTRAVFITHVQGFNGLTDKLIKELNILGIKLIEDVCESHGATHNEKRLGSIGWISNFSFYYAHHMSTIEGGMVSTNDTEVYQQLRMLRSHGMVRELTSLSLKNDYHTKYPNLYPEFIFAYPAFNVRNNEIGAIIGRSQLKNLDKNIKKRTLNFERFLTKLDTKKFYTEFELQGSSNYAFNLVLKNPDNEFMNRIIFNLHESEIEFRRGSAGGGNQLRQPYLKNIVPDNYYLEFPFTEYIHHYALYIGNYPDINNHDIDYITKIINNS